MFFNFISFYKFWSFTKTPIPKFYFCRVGNESVQGLSIRTIREFTCITVVKEDFFNKTEIFYNHILWTIPQSYSQSKNSANSFSIIFFVHFLVRIGLPFPVQPGIWGVRIKISRQTCNMIKVARSCCSMYTYSFLKETTILFYIAFYIFKRGFRGRICVPINSVFRKTVI